MVVEELAAESWYGYGRWNAPVLIHRPGCSTGVCEATGRGYGPDVTRSVSAPLEGWIDAILKVHKTSFGSNVEAKDVVITY
jgi:hypothetical protein